ncbi:MAG TPA: hypothetical protein VFU59_00605 [Candidatus Eisenbacteria bacterium]|nr:hypothetical protein [Candidatus Eisenbacteria bacterium]
MIGLVGVGWLALAALGVESARAESCGCLGAGAGFEQSPYEDSSWEDAGVTARLGVFHTIFKRVEGGLETGYVHLGRASSPFCGETGTLPCQLVGRALNAFDLSGSVRWRPKVGPVRPYVSVGGGAYAYKGAKFTESALVREVHAGISGAIGVHSRKRPGLGVEARWTSILDTGNSYDRNTDILSFLIGMNLGPGE